MSSFQALTLSLIVHIFLLFLMAHIEIPPLPASNQPVEIIYSEKSSSEKKRQMVEQVDVPLKNLLNIKPEEKPADFLSEKTVRVREEIQAAKSGPKQNRSNQPLTKKDIPNQHKPTEDDPSGNLPTSTNTTPQWNPGFSANDDALPANIRLGDFTALNTDAHLFYTFFSRIKEQIRYRWIQQVENAIESVRPSDLRSQTQNTWLTYIEVVLDREGKFLKASIMKPSGMPSFDKAAVIAFRNGAPFPNPPRELIKDDGKIYLEYAFQVNWDPSRVTFRNNF